MLQILPAYAVVYLYILAGLLGLVMGSALNCLSLRLARGRAWTGRSCCMSCGHTLAPRDLIPLLSWLLLRGKCRYCGAPVSARYPLTEGALALVYMSLLRRFGLSMEALSAAVLCSCLFGLSLVDLEIQIIPHRFLVTGAVFRGLELLLSGGFPALLRGIWPGLVIGGSVLLLSLVMDKVLRRDSLGGGDIKLLALLGMYFSLPECILLLILACIIGIGAALLTGKTRTAFPFGPALSLAAWLTLLAGQPIINWYMGLFY